MEFKFSLQPLLDYFVYMHREDIHDQMKFHTVIDQIQVINKFQKIFGIIPVNGQGGNLLGLYSQGCNQFLRRFASRQSAGMDCL